MVREAALVANMRGAKILRARLYLVKIKGANRSAVWMPHRHENIQDILTNQTI
ncbi:uncharacterized protein BKA55DRAFT_572186 [Fusarium redolens]|uniref:Uncharacterized protein n=1 Tax=Fusarium redolens TaxID=48865 RepID=A0A9P9GYH2_FUSRE|nr:uncharacterized protein BKA55DRAFT_572186 [Fusarium redolens]KAH7247531.1 hypothetical protein BKA55DRAFT_572186 [Fusarium redolens]